MLVFYLFHKLISELFFHPWSLRCLSWCRCGNFLKEWCAPATFRYWSGCKNWTCCCSYRPRSCSQIYCLWVIILIYLIYFYVVKMVALSNYFVVRCCWISQFDIYLSNLYYCLDSTACLIGNTFDTGMSIAPPLACPFASLLAPGTRRF